jgi:hypothetical protein
MMRFSTQVELVAFQSACDEVLELLRNDAERLARVTPSVSGWSPLQHAAHMTLANELVVRNMRSLSKGSGMLVVADAVQNPRGLAVLEAGVITRGRAQSPRIVVPPLDADVATTIDWAESARRDLAEFARTVDPERAPRCFIPHQLLGPLDLSEWARFGVVHTRHHLAIARDSLGAQ